jgi:CheY-like chemotaxis protein/CHASE3 domain sensor protein
LISARFTEKIKESFMSSPSKFYQGFGGFRNLKIGMQLRIALSTILILVLLLGAVSWFQTDSLWLNTKDLYDHPFTVRKAIGELQADFLYIYKGMKDLILANSELEMEAILREIDAHEANSARRFDVLYQSYLGPRQDIDEVRNALTQWKTTRTETIRLLRAGKIAEATERTCPSGVGGAQADKLMNELRDISDFAEKRADAFYANAKAKKETVVVSLVILLIVILVLAMGILYLLTQGIMEPLTELTSAAEKYRQGDFDARSRYISANEFGTLSAAFNALAETIQAEWRSSENTARIADVMLGNEELTAFCRALLPELIARTKSHIGAVYFLQEEKKLFEPYYAIGLMQEKMRPFSAETHEGEFGAALVQKTISRISNIPEDTIFDFATVAGNFKPKEIITIPIMQFQKVIAVISLASLNIYSTEALTIIKNSWKSLNVGIIGMLAFENIREYSHKLNEQAKELQKQTEELRQQNVELDRERQAVEEANLELLSKNEVIQAQSEELQAQSEELIAQSEELQAQYTELQGQNVDLNRQRLAVEEANRLKSQFLSNMSHELRTPLNSVMALSRVLLMQAGTKLSTEEVNYLEIIERNGKNLLTLINDILDLSKIEAGRMDVNPKPFSLRMTIDDIVESIAPLAAEKRIELRQDIPQDLPSLESDDIRVSQILQNLIANAVKFTEAGSVTVSARSDQGRFSVRIADTGIGVAENDLPFIFDEFRQVDGTSARKHEGTGLGLTIARKAARMLGGDITVQSAKGVGSIFTLTLPVAWQGSAPTYEPIVTRQPAGVKKSERKTILVVDDEPDMAAMISRYLLQEGYNTLTATSGAEALILAARECPFAITLDIIMPDMDGWEVLQGLKKNPETKDIPVIIVSISEGKETGFALGAIGYVTKPVSKKQLISEIEKIGKPGTRSIMIVDDNELDRRQIGQIIEEEGMHLIVAEDGAVCLELINKQIPDVLVLDLMMPELDGFTVLEKIRKNPETRDLPVIVVTAKDLTEEDRNKLSGNVFSILEKSVATPVTLLSEIKRILLEIECLPKNPAFEKLAFPPRILLIEDNEAAIIQVTAVLESAGYVVDVARGGQEAFDYVFHTIPEGVILDLMMPGIDGFEVLENIRGHQATQKIPVLILTAKDLTPEDFRRLNTNHIQQLVQKGDVDRESLLLKIGSMLGTCSGLAATEDRERRAEDEEKPPSVIRQPSSAIRQPKEAGGPPAILIVEDNPDNMTTIKAILQNRYRILEATDGEEGLRVAEETVPDLILLDMALPKMDGFAVVRYLKDSQRLSRIPVIALTARVMKGDREKILAAGCDDYISKPIDPQDCMKKLAEYLKG